MLNCHENGVATDDRKCSDEEWKPKCSTYEAQILPRAPRFARYFRHSWLPLNQQNPYKSEHQKEGR